MTPDFTDASVGTIRAFDVAVVGSGAVGIILALALAAQGFETCLIGTGVQARPGRTVALLAESVRLLEQLGLWRDLAAKAAPLATMRIVDATSSLFRTAPVAFEASEIGHDCFGYNVVNDDFEALLWGRADDTPGLTVVQSRAERFTFGDAQVKIHVTDHASVTASLVVGADGRTSLARKMAGIGVRTRTWPQVALTVLLDHQLPHRNTSTEFHTRQGPLTLVPLPATETAAHRSSLVWVMNPDEARIRLALRADALAETITRQTARLLGPVSLASDVGAFPIETSISKHLTGSRLVLTGEAAHALPPIGAQGLNLSFRDITTLVDCLGSARHRGLDIGRKDILDGYAQRRQGDISLRSAAVDTLNASLLSRSPATDLVRGLGLAALSAFGPLRRSLMREGLVPKGHVIRARESRT